MKFQAQVEQQQYQAECGKHVEVACVFDQYQARGVGAEENTGEHEQRDGRQADPAAEAGQDGGGQEGAAHGEQGVGMSHGSPPSGARRGWGVESDGIRPPCSRSFRRW